MTYQSQDMHQRYKDAEALNAVAGRGMRYHLRKMCRRHGVYRVARMLCIQQVPIAEALVLLRQRRPSRRGF